MRYNPNIGQIKEIEIIKELMRCYGMQFFDGGQIAYLYSDKYVIKFLDYLGENYLELSFWDLDRKYNVGDGVLETIAEEVDDRIYDEVVSEYKSRTWPVDELMIFDGDCDEQGFHKLRYLYYYAKILMLLKEHLDQDKIPNKYKNFLMDESFVNKLLHEKNSRPSK